MAALRRTSTNSRGSKNTLGTHLALEESSELLGRELRVFGLPEPGPPLELAALSTTLALVSTSGWHQLVPNLAREGELTARFPQGKVTSCKGLRRGPSTGPPALLRQGRDWLEMSSTSAPKRAIGRWQSCGGFLVSQSPTERSPATASSTLGVLVQTQGAPRPLLERTLRWSRAQSVSEESSEFLDSKSPALP